MGRVVAGVALGQARAEVLGVVAGDGLQIPDEHLDDRLVDRDVEGGLAEPPEAALRQRWELDLVLEVGIVRLQGVERSAEVGQDRLLGHAGVEADVDVRRAEVADGVGAAKLVLPAAPADNRADVEAGQAGQVGVPDVGELHRVGRLDGPDHPGNGVHALLFAANVHRPAERVDDDVHRAGVLGENRAGAVRLGDDGKIGAGAVLDRVDRADAAVQLAGHAGHGDVAPDRHVRALQRQRSHDAGSQAGLHVVDAMAEQLAVLDPRVERVAGPATAKRVNVDVAVEHDRAPATGAAQPGDRLLSARLDLLELNLQALLIQVGGEPLGARRLLGGERGDPHQVHREPDDLVVVDLAQDPAPVVGEGGHRVASIVSGHRHPCAVVPGAIRRRPPTGQPYYHRATFR
ncbi:MAG TPA: hypothetical protein VFH48_11870 [Chloroflexota bacterium]|nr:hypothetical protein [Chloroflexota bacterium]